MSRNDQRLIRSSLFQKTALILFGLILTVILLEAGLRLGGFVLSSLQEHRNKVSMSQRGTYRIMCLGESTTAGQYPPFLEDILNQRNIGIKFSVIDEGILGAKTYTILSLLESNLDTYHPDMVITMMGINDYGAHLPYEPISGSKAVNFLKSCRTYKLARLLWLHIVTRLKEFNESDFFLSRSKMPQAHVKEKNIPASEPLSKYEEIIKSGNSYRDQGKLSEAEVVYKKVIKLNPENDAGYVELGTSYRKQGRFSEAEESFEKAIELNPKNDSAYTELGTIYRNRKKYSEAERVFKKAIEFNPQNYIAYAGIGDAYRAQGKYTKAEEAFKKAIELNPQNYIAYAWIGHCYREQGKYSEAEESYKKVIERNTENDKVDRNYVYLGDYYWEQGKLGKAEELFKKFITLNFENIRIYGALETLYEEMGNSKLAQEYGEKAKELRSSRYNPTTVDSYRKLREILSKRGITYVCAQYPMRDLESLKKIFRGDTEGIIFVDNEQLFKNAVQREGYREYFRDMFGGDFGHCTQKGNRLLAENIANTILKEVFGK